MKKIFFLIGSSGSGKTTASKSVENMKFSDLIVCYSDREEVPTTEEMIKGWGSQEEWQRQNTIKWVDKIKREYLSTKDVLFDVQSRPNFIDIACTQCGVISYEVVLFDCSDEERKRRLISERNQPELANDQMMGWARYLRENCVGKNHTILDNTDLSPKESLGRLLHIMGKC